MMISALSCGSDSEKSAMEPQLMLSISILFLRFRDLACFGVLVWELRMSGRFQVNNLPLHHVTDNSSIF